MYGKNLEDFPDRFESFRDALKKLPIPLLNMALARCVETCKEFPVPAQVLEAADLITSPGKYSSKALDELRTAEATKAQRFIESGDTAEAAQKRREEFRQMVADSKANQMKPTSERFK